jgi:hypothetical protein
MSISGKGLSSKISSLLKFFGSLELCELEKPELPKEEFICEPSFDFLVRSCIFKLFFKLMIPFNFFLGFLFFLNLIGAFLS